MPVVDKLKISDYQMRSCSITEQTLHHRDACTFRNVYEKTLIVIKGFERLRLFVWFCAYCLPFLIRLWMSDPEQESPYIVGQKPKNSILKIVLHTSGFHYIVRLLLKRGHKPE